MVVMVLEGFEQARVYLRSICRSFGRTQILFKMLLRGHELDLQRLKRISAMALLPSTS